MGRGLPQGRKFKLFVLMHQRAAQIIRPPCLGDVLEGVPSRDSLVLLDDFNAHVSDDGVIRKWGIGRNAFPYLNLNGVLLVIGLIWAVHNKHLVGALDCS